MEAMGSIVNTGRGLLGARLQIDNAEERQAAIDKTFSRLQDKLARFARASASPTTIRKPETAAEAMERVVNLDFSSLKTFTLKGLEPATPRPVNTRTDAMWKAFDTVGDLQGNAQRVNGLKMKAEFSAARLAGTLTPDQQNFRALLPNGEVFFQKQLSMGDEMSDEERAHTQAKLNGERGKIGKALGRIEQLSETIENNFQIEGTLTQQNDDGSLSLGAFKLVHDQYGVMLSSDGEGNFSMFDEVGNGLDPLSYMKSHQGLQERYLATTIDVRF